MGLSLSSSKSYFLCQVCHQSFLREISGSLLCNDCRFNNKFLQLVPDDKDEMISSHLIYPSYTVVKHKKARVKLIDSFEPNFHKKINPKIKEVLATDENLGPRYRLIKSIVKYLDHSNYLSRNHFKGIFIHSMRTDDILFVHHPDIQDHDRILYLLFDRFVVQLKNINS